MKNKIVCIFILILIPLLLIGCDNNENNGATSNKAVLSHSYNKAIIIFNGKQEEVELKSWCHGEHENTIEIETKDGNKYLIDTKNLIMVNDKNI